MHFFNGAKALGDAQKMFLWFIPVFYLPILPFALKTKRFLIPSFFGSALEHVITLKSFSVRDDGDDHVHDYWNSNLV